MRQQNQELIYLDGMWLRKEQLLQLAIGSGNYAVAEHYLCALMADAVIKGRRESIVEVNQVRVHYGLKPIPMSEDDLEEEEDLNGKVKLTPAEKEAKMRFINMSWEGKLKVLRLSIKRLLDDIELFKYSVHWLAIFLVLRDRLWTDKLTQASFLDLAKEISPVGLPERLRLTESTMKNFSREFKGENWHQEYFLMKRNPHSKLCEVFWNIIQETILTENMTENL